jgi:hypothetical protein
VFASSGLQALPQGGTPLSASLANCGCRCCYVVKDIWVVKELPKTEIDSKGPIGVRRRNQSWLQNGIGLEAKKLDVNATGRRS